jgi:hypothetical protein
MRVFCDNACDAFDVGSLIIALKVMGIFAELHLTNDFQDTYPVPKKTARL